MSHGKTGDYDPGWNDPPLFSYDQAAAIQASASKRGNVLNKRVAFPLSGITASSNSPAMDPTLPLKPCSDVTSTPPLSCSLPKPVPTITTEHNDSKISIANSKELLNSVLENLSSIVNFDEDEEIGKRIDVMKKLWLEDKLNTQIHQKMLELSEALKEGNIDTADNIQKGLMVDYVGQCSSWMSGIRHLVLLARSSKT